MNREIKFRCWNVEEKIMHNPAFPSWNGRIEVWQDNKQQTKVQYLSYGPADEGILMQFTGLKDKNGVEVYEGDVVKWTDMVHNHGTGFTPVKYSEVFARFCGNSHPTNDGFRPSWGLEVIGNIYEHPELLNL